MLNQGEKHEKKIYFNNNIDFFNDHHIFAVYGMHTSIPKER